MENITVKDIVDMTGGVLLCGEPDTCLTDICTDSRQVKEGDLFVPIIGANLDGHRYIKKALETGSATLTSKREGALCIRKMMRPAAFRYWPTLS